MNRVPRGDARVCIISYPATLVINSVLLAICPDGEFTHEIILILEHF